MVGDVGLAEEFAQDALVAALERWPESGVPDHPGAWLMTIARRRAIDHWRRRERLDRKLEQLGRDAAGEEAARDFDVALEEAEIGDDARRRWRRGWPPGRGRRPPHQGRRSLEGDARGWPRAPP